MRWTLLLFSLLVMLLTTGCLGAATFHTRPLAMTPSVTLWASWTYYPSARVYRSSAGEFYYWAGYAWQHCRTLPRHLHSRLGRGFNLAYRGQHPHHDHSQHQRQYHRRHQEPQRRHQEPQRHRPHQSQPQHPHQEPRRHQNHQESQPHRPQRDRSHQPQRQHPHQEHHPRRHR